jgi:hypothetical protein
MRASDLHRAVSRATGESLASIRRRGFSLLGASESDRDDCDQAGSGFVDWDALDASRRELPPWALPQVGGAS